MTTSEVTQTEIQDAVRRLELSGQALCVHSSLRSFGWVRGGADAVIDALLAEDRTLMVPTMSRQYKVAPPQHLRPPRNGVDYEAWDREHAGDPVSTLVYTPESNELDRGEMGAIPAAVLARPERVRGNDPVGSFSALGPLAAELLRDQTASAPYAQFQALSDRRGSIVLMGVGLDRLTLLHYGESLAGRNLFMRWSRDQSGETIPVSRGGCSSGFPRLEPQLGHLIRETRVGNSLWKILPANETLDAAARIIREQPQLTHCDDAACRDCNDAVLGGPILDGF